MKRIDYIKTLPINKLTIELSKLSEVIRLAQACAPAPESGASFYETSKEHADRIKEVATQDWLNEEVSTNDKDNNTKYTKKDLIEIEEGTQDISKRELSKTINQFNKTINEVVNSIQSMSLAEDGANLNLDKLNDIEDRLRGINAEIKNSVSIALRIVRHHYTYSLEQKIKCGLLRGAKNE